MRVVNADDLQNGGWMCEACPHIFEVGEIAQGTPVVMVGDQVVEGEWRCADCFDAGRPMLQEAPSLQQILEDEEQER